MTLLYYLLVKASLPSSGAGAAQNGTGGLCNAMGKHTLIHLFHQDCVTYCFRLNCWPYVFLLKKATPMKRSALPCWYISFQFFVSVLRFTDTHSLTYTTATSCHHPLYSLQSLPYICIYATRAFIDTCMYEMCKQLVPWTWWERFAIFCLLPMFSWIVSTGLLKYACMCLDAVFRYCNANATSTHPTPELSNLRSAALKVCDTITGSATDGMEHVKSAVVQQAAQSLKSVLEVEK